MFSQQTMQKHSRLRGAEVTHSVCPYCAVGCGQNVYTKAGQVINIEGNPDSPINEGTLCPKGANTFQLLHNPHRVKHVLYRAPFATRWERKSIDWALEQIALRIRNERDQHLENKALKTIGTLGGATLDNEENYLIKKLFSGGLGVLSVENQARI